MHKKFWKVEDLSDAEKEMAIKMNCNPNAYYMWHHLQSNDYIAIQAHRCPICRSFVSMYSNTNCEHLEFIFESVNNDFFFERNNIKKSLIGRIIENTNFEEFFPEIFKGNYNKNELKAKKEEIANKMMSVYIQEEDIIKGLLGSEYEVIKEVNDFLDVVVIYGFKQLVDSKGVKMRPINAIETAKALLEGNTLVCQIKGQSELIYEKRESNLVLNQFGKNISKEELLYGKWFVKL